MTKRFLGRLPYIAPRAGIPPLRGLMRAVSMSDIPNDIDWSKTVKKWGMLGNDVCGDCTLAAALHQVQGWTANAGIEIVPDTDCAVSAYADMTGYNPLTGLGDNGAIVTSVLHNWMAAGIPVSDKGALNVLDGFATVDPKDRLSVMRAIAAFGGVYAGVDLPTSAEAEIDAKRPWAATSDAPGGWGGHAVPLIAYDDDGPICITWGAIQRMTWGWWQKYASESYALLRREWLGAKDLSPSGLTIGELAAQITAMRGTLGLGITG